MTYISAVSVSSALRLLERKPRNLQEALDTASRYESEPPVSIDELVEYVRLSPADDLIRREIHKALARWDAQDGPSWADSTRHQTAPRRDRIYALLGLGTKAATAFDELFPPHIATDPGFEITGDYERWFDQDEQERLGFYWPHYQRLLVEVEGWPQESVANLSRASKQVVERLGDPLAASPHAARGLVVGYVQSGKTANFTGVIARAVDAGYRLIVVLTGMTTILRDQTQRRVDKQLIGQELLQGGAAGAFEYADAPDWDNFISYGGRPSERGTVDWRRLTSLGQDYRRLGAGIGALHFEKIRRELPFNTRENLDHSPVRLIVAKKQVAPLNALLADLKQARRSGVPLGEVPALIIDDESDQASINTRKPMTQMVIRQRTAINRRIVDLLELLPRAQYVGYTATPFANVFVDPNDALGIFPKDFIIGLDRPDGYMGSSDYHDFGPPPLGRPRNEEVHVRDVRGSDDEPENLLKALDSYFLSGAIKLYRASVPGCEINVRHHTMLVHTSHLVSDHRQLRDALNELIDHAGYVSGRAWSRLDELFVTDFRKWSLRREPSLPFPESLQDLRPWLEQCFSRVLRDGSPVIVVNGEKEFESETPAFDTDEVWKILVGGTKLSRGYTVEGLTVSYYRRTARAADTLMQMGRWFGFRHNYSDLMRLFIGRAEALSRTKSIDLYAAFGAICQDELDFREELKQYALPDDGSAPLRPMDVAPLVSQRFPDVKPTASNRMFNAIQISANFGGKAINPTLAPVQAVEVEANQAETVELFGGVDFEQVVIGAGDTFKAYAGRVSPDALIKFLERYEFSKKGLLARQISFLKGDLGNPAIDQWVLLWPRLDKDSIHGSWALHGTEIPIIERYRYETGRFNVYTGPDHVAGARLINQTLERPDATEDTSRLAGPRTGAGLFYAVRGPNDRLDTIGFALYPPKNDLREKTKWGVVVANAPDVPIVPAA